MKKPKLLVLLLVTFLALGTSCQNNETPEQKQKREAAGGCVKCQCNKWSDSNGDYKCDTTRNNDSSSKCQHPEVDH